MAVTLRLARRGNKHRPVYRIVATEKQNKRDGKFLETLGVYNPKTNPPTCTLNGELVQKWVAVGAKATKIVESLIKKQVPGLLESRSEHQKKKVQAARKKRKERAAKSTSAKK